MHERYSWPQSHDLFLAHVNRQFLCRETRIEGGGGRWSQWWGMGGAGPGIKWEKKVITLPSGWFEIHLFLYHQSQTMKSNCSSRNEPSVSALRVRQEMKMQWLFYVIIKIFTERLRVVIAWGSRSPEQVLSFTNETYFPGQSENFFCLRAQTNERPKGSA